MKEFIGGIFAGIGFLILWFAGMALAAFIVQGLAAVAVGLTFGFWQTFAGLWLIRILSNSVFSGIRPLKFPKKESAE